MCVIVVDRLTDDYRAITLRWMERKRRGRHTLVSDYTRWRRGGGGRGDGLETEGEVKTARCRKETKRERRGERGQRRRKNRRQKATKTAAKNRKE